MRARLAVVLIAVLLLISFLSRPVPSVVGTAVGRSGGERWAIAPYCCLHCSTGAADCCCPPHNKRPATVKVLNSRTVTVFRTLTVTKARKARRSSSGGETRKRQFVETAEQVEALKAPLDQYGEFTKPSYQKDETQVFGERNLCPVCPSGVDTSLPISQANSFCCRRRVTITKTFGRPATIVKRVTVTVTPKPTPNTFIAVNLKITTPDPITGAPRPLANTSILVYIPAKKRALTVVAKTTTNFAGSARIKVSTSYSNSQLGVAVESTGQTIAQFTVPTVDGATVNVSSPSLTSETSTTGTITTGIPSESTTSKSNSVTRPTTSNTPALSTAAKTSSRTKTRASTLTDATTGFATGVTTDISTTVEVLTTTSETERATVTETLTTPSSSTETETLTRTASITTTTHAADAWPQCDLGNGNYYGPGTLLAAAGTSLYGNDLPANSSHFSVTGDLAWSINGDLLIVDVYHHAVRLVNMTAGNVSTIAGIGYFGTSPASGPATSVPLYTPMGIATDPNGTLYVTGYGANLVYKLVPTGSTPGAYNTSVLAGNGTSGNTGDGGPATSAEVKSPWGIVADVDSYGNVLVYFASGNRIRLVNSTTGIITTLAGNDSYTFSGDHGPASSATMKAPRGLHLSNGSLYVADWGNHRIRKIDLTFKNITTVYGTGSSLVINGPYKVVVLNNTLYVSDGTAKIKTYDTGTSTGGVYAGTGTSGFSGDGGNATAAKFGTAAYSILWDQSNATKLFVADSDNNRIRVIEQGIVTTVAGDGQTTIGVGTDGALALNSQVKIPYDIYAETDGTMIITASGRVWMKDASGILSTIAGNGTTGLSGDDGPGTSAQVGSAIGNTKFGDVVYWAEWLHHGIRRLNLTSGTISTVAGVVGSSGSTGNNGPATSAKLNSPMDVAISSDGTVLLIADQTNHAIRQLNFTSGNLTTIAGNLTNSGASGDGGPATSAKLNSPRGVAIDNSGNIYIADAGNCIVRKVDAITGFMSTIAGQAGNCTGGGDNMAATSVSLGNVRAIHADKAGNVYVADPSFGQVRKIWTKGIITTVAGTSVSGGSSFPSAYATTTLAGLGLNATAVPLANPSGLFIDAYDNVFVADSSQSMVLVVLATSC